MTTESMLDRHVRDIVHPAVASLGGPCVSDRSRHLSRNSTVSEMRDSGFSGYVVELHHRQPERRHTLQSLC